MASRRSYFFGAETGACFFLIRTQSVNLRCAFGRKCFLPKNHLAASPKKPYFWPPLFSMKKEQTSAPATKDPAAKGTVSLFDRENLLWMAAGGALLLLGFLLMRGGASDDPNVFNKEEVYSTTRITIAPILVLAGFVVLIFGIFRKGRHSHNS